MKYLRNTWYVAAWSHDVKSDAAFARTLLDTRIVFWRNASGAPVAVLDRCPHRFAPLSMGTVKGDTITCRYHGLTFDGATGACNANPHGPIPNRLAVQAFPLVERHRAIWIWMGDATKADPALIPDFSYLSAAKDTAFSSGYLHNHGSYDIYVDNILDLSHTDFLHPGTLAGAGITGTKADVTEGADWVEVLWLVRNGPAIPALRQLVPTLPENIDSWTRVRWYAPGAMKLTVVTVAPGAGESGRNAVMTENAHVLTPETATSCHYFFASTRNFAIDNPLLNQVFAQVRQRIFEGEDKPMVEAIQKNMGDAEFWSLKPLLLPVDAGPVRVRRRLEALIEAESKTKVEVVGA